MCEVQFQRVLFGKRVTWWIVLRVSAPIPCRLSRLHDRLNTDRCWAIAPHGAAHDPLAIHERPESTDCWLARLGKTHTQNGLAGKMLKTKIPCVEDTPGEAGQA